MKGRAEIVGFGDGGIGELLLLERKVVGKRAEGVVE